MKKNWKLFLDNALNLFCMSVITGLFAGVVVTLYNICMSLGEKTATNYYALLLQNPAFIPLLFVGLAAGAIVIGTVVCSYDTRQRYSANRGRGARRNKVQVVRNYVLYVCRFACLCVYGLSCRRRGTFA